MDELKKRILQDIIGKDDVILTESQELALSSFLDFTKSQEELSTLLLRGSAGTGKTFLIDIFSKYLQKQGFKVILLAPTGRAAKVITQRTGRLAYTVHHHIYNVQESSIGPLFVDVKHNKASSRTVYIVDEASMVGDDENGAKGGLLHDILRYVFGTDAYRKLILVGDPIQLPPVGYADSPALNPDTLRFDHRLTVFEADLSEIKRQDLDSTILYNANLLRQHYEENTPEAFRIETGYDLQLLENAYDSLETFMGYYREGDTERVVFLTYSNYQSVKVNKAIRHQLWGQENLLVPGDMIMVVKNNYAWGDQKKIPFLANGEMGMVKELYQDTHEEKYGLEWIDAEIEFADKEGEPFLVEAKLILSLLQDKKAQVDRTTLNTIVQARRSEYMELPPSKAAAQLRADPYINGLQIKYGYCITGHKSQGGQWENVIIGFEPDYGQNPQAYLRWTYTACTRASERLFLLNCAFVDT